MNSGKPAVSFDEIIQAGRQKKELQDLANDIFSRNRRGSDVTKSANSKRTPREPSLASRVGVQKRSTSSTNIKPGRSNPFNPPSRPASAAAQIARTNRIAAVLNSNHNPQSQITHPSDGYRAKPAGTGLSIRGTAAGPFVVEARNFAPGTTAADIESAVPSVVHPSNGSSSNGMISCRIISTKPTVVAEMVFAEKATADNVIKAFHGEKADGRILSVFMRASGPGSAPSVEPGLLGAPASEPLFISDSLSAPVAKDLFEGDVIRRDDVEMGNGVTAGNITAAYDNGLESAIQDRRERERDRAESDIRDGRYGINQSQDQPPPDDNAMAVDDTQLDEQQDPPHPRDDRKGDQRERNQQRRNDDRDRDRDRDRHYDDRRDDRGGSYRRDDYGSRNSYNQSQNQNGGGRQSHYGNGVGGHGPNPGAGAGGDQQTNPALSRRYGVQERYRMYSDDVLRGGGSRGGPPLRGGGGGSYRGGYR